MALTNVICEMRGEERAYTFVDVVDQHASTTAEENETTDNNNDVFQTNYEAHMEKTTKSVWRLLLSLPLPIDIIESVLSAWRAAYQEN